MSKTSENDGISESGGDAVIELRAVPRASKTMLQRGADGYRLRIAAPPVEGTANAKAVAYLAKLLGAPKSSVTLISGERGRSKRFRIAGMSAEQVRSIFREAAK